MRLTVRRRPAPAAGEPHLVEVVTPRTNTAALTSAEHLLASIGLPDAFALEVAADASRRQFLVRAATPRMRQQLESQLGAAYPQAELRRLDPELDPARQGPDERVAVRTLHLRESVYLPIRTFRDLDLDGERSAQADPVLGVLSALGDLPTGWRGVSQIVLQPAREDWCRKYLRLAVQHPLEHERVPRPTEATLSMFAFVSLLLGAVVLGLQGYVLWQAAEWLQLVGLVTLVVLALGVGLPRVVRMLQPPVYDMELVREKVARVAYHAEIRLAVFAPRAAEAHVVGAHLERLIAAYRRYNLAAGNGFVPRAVRPGAPCVALRQPVALAPRRRPILTTLELAGLWHLPHAAADVALLERTTARKWLPLPSAVASGCRVGEAVHQGRSVPVSVPDDLLRRHLLLVAKTRRGKSTLLLRLAHHAMTARQRGAVVLVDPHRDLAWQAVSQVPEARSEDVVFLDVANMARPFGLNLLDVALGWDRDRAVANALSVFEREWGDRFWGPRMEDAFRFALMTLFDANLAICAADPEHGPATQYTILDVPTMLSDARFRKSVLAHLDDATVHSWWEEYYETLERRFQQEMANPVLSKVHRFDGSTAVRHIVGQPVSTINPSAWVRQGRIAVVNTARGSVGENAAALIGSTILNLVSLGIAQQADLDASERHKITLLVDEFHTIPGADYEGMLAELSKYGANLVLATQSLARLAELDQAQGRGLRAVVFANIDGLFAFNCSAEDAEYLVPELGGAIDAQDLVELAEHQCYARISSSGQRLPTFWVKLDEPLADDASRAAALASASAERYGRDRKLVEADRKSAFARVRATREPPPVVVSTGPARNEHRPRKRRRPKAEVVAGA